MNWLLRGAVMGLAAGLATVAIVGTGGLAAVAIVGGMVAGGAGIMEVMSTMSGVAKEVTGAIFGPCSGNVFTNGKRAARAHVDMVACSKHPPVPIPIATGSGNVYINGQPAARVSDTIVCSAVITDGSGNVYIGGGTQKTDDIAPEDLVPPLVHGVLLVVGIGAAVVLAGPIVAVAGLALGMAGGMAGNWVGGKVFGEGSDGQKWSMLGGGMLGGMLGGKGGTMLAGKVLPRPATPLGGFVKEGLPGMQAVEAAAAEPSISLFGFRGAGSHKDLLAADAPHPYVVTGHVGYSFDDGATIYGFGPKVPGSMSAFEAVQSLRKGDSYPGIITNDTPVFQSVANNPAMGRGGVPQVVIKQKIPVTKAEFDAIKAAHEGMGTNPMDNIKYGFPGQNACTFNCATFPSKLGIPIPEESGAMRNYMPLLEELGTPWKP